MGHRFYRDARGDPRAQMERGRRLLGRFLESEIQGSPALCDLVLAALAEVASGRKKRRQITGNAHTLILSGRRARIHPEFGSGPDLVIPPQELEVVLREWQALLQGRPPRPSRRH